MPANEVSSFGAALNARTARHWYLRPVVRCALFLAWAAVLSISSLRAQSAAPQASGQPQQSPQTPQTPSSAASAQPVAASEKPEMNTHDSTVPLESRVNLVPLRVVVRDAKGHIVANLRKEDFQVFEDGKLQDISHFSVETPASLAQTFARSDPVAGSTEAEKPSPDFLPPSRFVAFLFDDVHIALQDLMRTRIAATRFVDSSVEPTDRVAIFTISGQSQVDFTADRDKLRSALMGLMPRPVAAASSTGTGQCPPVDYYQASLYQDQHDPNALNVATADALACAFYNNAEMLQQAQALAYAAIMQAYGAGQVQTDSSFRRLEEVLRRISALPGQRSLVLLSPGFIYPNREYELSQIIDRANRSNVFINTLDARGVYTPDMGDIAQPDPGSPIAAGPRSLYRQETLTAQSDVLRVLADGTGGLAFRNNNDLAGGLGMIAATPEVSYLIAFTPHNLKYDGKFHSLKVTLLTKDRVTIQARRGFYAPKHSISVEEAAKEEIEEALFSQDVQHGLPVELHTQYYKVDSLNAKLAVMTHVDLGHIRFEKAAGRNQDNLTIVAALFDRDGNIITGLEKTLEMHLRDTTLERLSRTGLTVKTSFDVKPGDYVVRLVVRDSNAAQLSAENGVVQIPY
jgi:VWFA-related protein